MRNQKSNTYTITSRDARTNLDITLNKDDMDSSRFEKELYNILQYKIAGSSRVDFSNIDDSVIIQKINEINEHNDNELEFDWEGNINPSLSVQQ